MLGFSSGTKISVGLVSAPGPGGTGGGGTIDPANESANLVPAYLTDTVWKESSSSVTQDADQPDRNGNLNAVKVTFLTPDNHHQWIELGSSPTSGDRYEIRVWANPDTIEGFSGAFEVGYYNGSQALTTSDYTITEGAGWQQIVHRFTAPTSVSDPRIRLVGWDNGLEGEAVNIGEIEFVNLDNPDDTLSGTSSSDGTESMNLIDAYITSDSTWKEASADVEKTYGLPDRNGDPNAAKITFLNDANHHQWVELLDSLRTGDAFEARVWIYPDTTEGFSGSFEIGYYDGSTALAEHDYPVSIGNGWQQIVHQFTPSTTPVDPRIRLVGWNNGAAGESVIIGEIELVNLSDANYTLTNSDGGTATEPTAIDPGQGTYVTGSDILTHSLPEIQAFNVERAPDRGATILWNPAPQSTTIDDVLLNDYGAVYDGGWDWENIDVAPAADGPFGERFLRTNMEAGSHSGTDNLIRGAGFDTRTMKRERVFLTYKVRFRDGFDFVKGGKLPGLMGGDSPSGGSDALDGFTCRMMWRSDGMGELYLYCMNKEHDYGNSRGRGTFYWTPGQWHTVEQEVILNDVDYDNGWIRIWIDGQPLFEQRGVIFRDRSTIQIEGIMHTIFFGGSDDTWAATRDEWIETADFAIYTSPTAEESI